MFMIYESGVNTGLSHVDNAWDDESSTSKRQKPRLAVEVCIPQELVSTDLVCFVDLPSLMISEKITLVMTAVRLIIYCN